MTQGGLPGLHRFPIPDPHPLAPWEEHPGGDQQERELRSSALHCTTCTGTRGTRGPAQAVISPGKQDTLPPSLTTVSTGSFTPILQLATSRAAGGASRHNSSRTHSTQPTALPSTCPTGWS